MNTFALSLALLAAFLHATWNAVVKANGERAVVLGAIAFVHFVLGVVLAALSPAPARESWPMIAASGTIHYLYYFTLFQSYQLGDLSHVYPISRGIAPFLVAIGAWIFAGEVLSPGAMAGLAAISLGIGLLALSRGALNADPRAVVAALATGTMIAAYSVVDGLGIRASGSPMGYIGWLFVTELPITLVIAWRRRRILPNLLPRTIAQGLAGGTLSAAAYGIVLYAKTLAPLAAISAVRESSVIVAALIGVVLFKERPWRRRVACAALVALGVIALAVSP